MQQSTADIRFVSMGIFIRSGHTGGYGRHFRKQKKVMLGRGILQDPGLVGELRMVEAQFAAKDTGTPVGNKKCNVVDKQTLRAFHDDICDWLQRRDVRRP